MSERDDMVEQAYHQPPLPPVQSSPTQRAQHQAGQGLDYLLAAQRRIEEGWGRLPDTSDPVAVSEYIRQVVLCATDELHEALAEVHWKPWKEPRGIKDVAKYREEMADVLHFILDLYIAAGLTGQDIVDDYMTKHAENLSRLKSAEYRAS